MTAPCWCAMTPDAPMAMAAAELPAAGRRRLRPRLPGWLAGETEAARRLRRQAGSWPGRRRCQRSPPAPKPDLSKVSARKNLNETAFFFPQLTSDSNGVVRMTFTMPEALTKWQFLGFAHDRSVRSGFLEDHAVTAKDLMVQPNPPRFLREGDTVEFTVKVSNQTAKPQRGKVRLTFTDALNNQSGGQAARQHASPSRPSTSRPRNRAVSPGASTCPTAAAS